MSGRAVLLLGLVLARPVAASGDSEGVRRSLEARVPRLMELAQVPGVAVAVVRGAGVETWTHGTADARSGAPVDDGTVFEAASISKPVFAWAVLKLVEEGRLDLDRPLVTYLAAPWIPDPRASSVTARMVLTHRTGFPNWRPHGKDLVVVFEPLGMSRSSYVWLPSYDAAKAWGHDETGRAIQRRRPEGPNAAASLDTTAGAFGPRRTV